MNTGVSPAFSPASTRSVPRFRLAVPLALTVLRSGIPNHIHGCSLEMGEGGMGVVPASRLLIGESVRVEFLVPHLNTPVRATAVVRYQYESSFGLQFLRLPVEQQSVVRYWTRRQGELLLPKQELPTPELPAPSQPATGLPSPAQPTPTSSEPHLGTLEEPALESSSVSHIEGASRKFRFTHVLRFAIPLTVIAVVLGWWHWEQGWSELESQLPPKESAAVQPQLKVAGDEMGSRITYKILPEYPEAARQAGVQGTVVLDIVVNRAGAVTELKYLSGPEALSFAATDAVRWWRYQPYLVNGQPTAVETTVAVNFRLTN